MDTMSGSQQSFDVFDVRKIRKLISLMQENDLTEIDLKHADSAVRIKRGGEVASYSAPAVAPPVAPVCAGVASHILGVAFGLGVASPAGRPGVSSHMFGAFGVAFKGFSNL